MESEQRSKDKKSEGNTITTLSGAEIGWHTPPPPLEDILRGLAALPRFAGQTIVPWSVLDHSNFVLDLGILDEKRGGLAATPAQTLMDFNRLCLIHDFSECFTGDIPTPIKPPKFKELERVWVERAFFTFFPPKDGKWRDLSEAWRFVEIMDKYALAAEQLVLRSYMSMVIDFKHNRFLTSMLMDTAGKKIPPKNRTVETLERIQDLKNGEIPALSGTEF